LHRHQIDASLRERERQLAEALRSVEDGILARDQEQSPLKSPDQETPGEIDNSNRALERQVVERTQQLEAANKELEAFSYSVAHDLRAPLRGIDGFSQALIESHAAKLGPEGLEHLRHLRGSAKRMSHLIEDLLRLSRVARSELKRTRVDLSQQARAIRDDLITSDKERNVVFTIQDGVSVEGDEQLLRIVLENLLRNAWKFTANKPQAQIHFGSVEIDGRSVCQVKDNGAGFDSAYAHKLFRAFQRLHTEREFEGTGIGLAIVHRIVTRHGGRIWAEAAPDVGATFSFSV
jgi:light-regulated signal transduction histidine kinase (bacteriophytochrome)